VLVGFGVEVYAFPEKICKGAPLSYLPDRRGTTDAHGERNKYGRDPDANRKVICPDGWAAKSGHPATRPPGRHNGHGHLGVRHTLL
jgi:hypothetical protein